MLHHYLRIEVTPEVLRVRPIGVRRLPGNAYRREEPMPVYHAPHLAGRDEEPVPGLGVDTLERRHRRHELIGDEQAHVAVQHRPAMLERRHQVMLHEERVGHGCGIESPR